MTAAADPFFFVTVLLGLCLGSFATALSHRLPRGVPLLSAARSSCPSCDRTLAARDLVPLLSWLWLKGRCRFCAAPISARYPLIELATLALCLGFHAAYGFAPVMLALAPVLVAMADIDLRFKIIPDALNACVLAAGVLMLALSGPDAAQAAQAASGLLVWAGGALALRLAFSALLKQEALGLGDVKLLGSIGFWLGTDAVAGAAFLALAGGGGVVLALLWRRVSGERDFPFGPALVLAFIAVLLWQTPFLPT